MPGRQSYGWQPSAAKLRGRTAPRCPAHAALGVQLRGARQLGVEADLPWLRPQPGSKFCQFWCGPRSRGSETRPARPASPSANARPRGAWANGPPQNCSALLDRIKALENDNRALRGAGNSENAMDDGESEKDGQCNVEELQELYNVCLRVQPGAPHTADIKTKLDEARRAKAEARPLPAQTANAEKNWRGSVVRRMPPSRKPPIWRRHCARPGRAQPPLPPKLGSWSSTGSAARKSHCRQRQQGSRRVLSCQVAKLASSRGGLGPQHGGNMAAIEAELKNICDEAATLAPTQRVADPAVPDDGGLEDDDAQAINEVIAGLLGGASGSAGPAAPVGEQLRADAVKRMADIVGHARKKARGG